MEKVCFYFKSENLTIGDIKFDIWAYSLPTILTVHASQDIQAYATSFWDHAFGELRRTPFVVPQEGSWDYLANTLSENFRAETGRGLSHEDKQFLKQKALAGLPVQTNTISWNRFCKDMLPGREYSFWEWFYQTMKFTKEHIGPIWAKGYVKGFISRAYLEEMLRSCVPGTFMLRFSDSELGGISIAYINCDNQIQHIQPFTDKNLATRSLAASIMDLDELVILYPNIPKIVFKDLVEIPKPRQNNGPYVTPRLTIYLPNSRPRTTSIELPSSFQTMNEAMPMGVPDYSLNNFDEYGELHGLTNMSLQSQQFAETPQQVSMQNEVGFLQEDSQISNLSTQSPPMQDQASSIYSQSPDETQFYFNQSSNFYQSPVQSPPLQASCPIISSPLYGQASPILHSPLNNLLCG